MVVKLFFNDRCFKRIYCNESNAHRRSVNHCILHARKFREVYILPEDFFNNEERFPTLFDEFTLVKVSLGKGYHYEFYA